MYQEYYRLNDSPFRLTPDPQYLYLTPCHKEALAQIYYGVSESKGFMVLIGEVGTGKTLLLNHMLDVFNQNDILSAYIFNPVTTAADMFEYISADFGLECDSISKSRFLIRLNKLLIDRYSSGKKTVLIVDEAQNLSFNIFEELRMLTNLETSKEKLLQIVLAGQPELGVKLDHPSLRQLKQRISMRCSLKPLTFEETKDYICTRLKIAGLKGKPPFDFGAVETIHILSGGIPRLINNICDNAMLAGYAYDKSIIDRTIIKVVGDDLKLTKPNPIRNATAVIELNEPKIRTEKSRERAYRTASAEPGLLTSFSEMMRRFTRSFSRKERVDLANNLK